LKVIVMAQGWKQRIIAGEVYCQEQLATEAKLNPSYVSRILHMGALSPEIVEEILQEGVVAGRSIKSFAADLPLNWKQQAALWA
jgi:ParB-like chromosome segregation protein Spo0J